MKVYTIYDQRGHAAHMFQDGDKWLSSKEIAGRITNGVPLPSGCTYEVTDYTGKIIETRYDVERIMSDVWATYYNAYVWTGTEIRKIWISGDGQTNHFVVGSNIQPDATPEVVEAVRKYRTDLAEKARQERERLRLEEEAYQAAIPDRGKVVEVVRGRKVPIGTKGFAFWSGFDRYGKRQLGIAISPQKDARGRYSDVVWTAASNCEVVNPKPQSEADKFPMNQPVG